MPKLVEYPPPPSPALTIEQRWYGDGYFDMGGFSDSELETSGLWGLVSDSEAADADARATTFADGSDLQQLVVMAFEKRSSGVFRALWLLERRHQDFVETTLFRFPQEAVGAAREIMGMINDDDEDSLEPFIQCVAMLHAYTGLPAGEKSAEQFARDMVLVSTAEGKALLDSLARSEQGS